MLGTRFGCFDEANPSPFALQENLDSLFGAILAKVAEIGDLDSTLVIVASDHGEM